MGSAAVLQLARRGLRTIGFDRLAPPHTLGSSHGHVRLIREAYYEGQLYVPLVRRAFELWRALDEQSGGRLLTATGALMVGRAESGIVTGATESARAHDIPHELLRADEIMERFPAFVADSDHVALYEPGAALLHPELCVAYQLELASRLGAQLCFHEPVARWTETEDGVELRTETGRYHVNQLVLCPGAWMAELLGDITLPLTVERQVQHWWEPAQRPELFRPGRMPVSMWETDEGRLFYTMSDTGHGVKIGWHHSGLATSPDGVDRNVSAPERAVIATLLERYLPLARGRERDAAVCLYTNTPDGDFIVARHPLTAAALIVSACSGHGFKFATVVGEIVADLVTTGQSAFDLTPFAVSRFS